MSNIEQEVMPVVQQAKDIQVIDAPSEVMAGEVLSVVKALMNKVQEQFGPAVEAAHKSHKEALAVKKRFEDPLKAAELSIKRAIGGYRAKLQAEADAERRRLEAIARKEAEEARRKEVEALRKAGEASAAAVKMHIPVVVKPVAQVVLPPKPKGFHTRANWKARVVDSMALCKAVANGTAPIAAVEPSMTVLNTYAREMKEKFNIPGVEAYNDSVVSSTGSRDVEITEF